MAKKDTSEDFVNRRSPSHRLDPAFDFVAQKVRELASVDYCGGLPFPVNTEISDTPDVSARWASKSVSPYDP